MKRSYSMDFLKFLFAIFIAMGHFSEAIISSGIVVNLFFIISGYFLVNSFDSSKYENSWEYSFQRLKRIYPYYIFAFIVLFLYTNINEGLSMSALIKAFFKSLPEIFLVQNIGVFPGGINYPLWQLCTLIVVSHIMFSLMKWDRQMTTNVLCPLIAIGAYTYFANAYDAGMPNDWGVECQFIYVPLIRAAANLSIGMLVNYPIKKCLNYLESSNNRFMPTIVSIIGMGTILVFWINRTKYVIIIPFLFLMISMLYSKSIFSKLCQFSIFSKMDKLALAIYLNHAFIIKVYNQIKDYFSKYDLEKNNIIYIFILICYSILMLFIVDYFMVKLKRICARLK